MDFAMFLAALKATLSADDPKAAIGALIKEVEAAASSGAPEPSPDEPTSAEGQPEEDKDKPVAAKAAPVPASPAAPPVSVPSFQDVRAAAKAEADTIRRDLLLDKHGARLEPSVARWAASQSLSVVKGLIGALPKDATQVAAKRASATRGAGAGKGAAGAGLPEENADELAERMGIVRAGARRPHVSATGSLVLPTMTSSGWAAVKAAAQPQGAQ